MLIAVLMSAFLVAGGLAVLLGSGTSSGAGWVIGALAIVIGWTVLAWPAMEYRATARSLKDGHDELLRAGVAHGEAAVEAVRESEKSVRSTVGAVQSALKTEQQNQRRTLARIELSLKSLAVTVAPPLTSDRSDGIDILFVTSNGAGLGHLSRLMAIAKKLPGDRRVEFLTLSKAYRQAASVGFTVHYFPSAEAAGQQANVWNAALRDHVRELLVSSRPSIVVFDGTWVYAGLSDTCRALRVPLLWVQRGMWRPEVDATARQRHRAIDVAQSVIVPGDFAMDERVDAGEGVAIHHVEPIVMTEMEDVLSRGEACERLGLDPGRRYVLVNLGGGVLTDPTTTASSTLRALRDLAPDLVPVQVVSPLAESSDPVPGVIQVVAYPVMTCARAFEFQVAAAGYNASQEAVALRVPTILIPNARTRTDDQVRRAALLAERGLVLSASDDDELENAIGTLAEGNLAERMRAALREVTAPTGSAQAAQILEDFLIAAQWTSDARSIHASQNGRQG